MRSKEASITNGKNYYIPLNNTLNTNGLNSPIKWHRLDGWIKKQDPTIFLPTRNAPQWQIQT
jgi:hypothetical protein